MTIENLVNDMSELKVKLVLIEGVDMKRFNQSYFYATDMMICKTGNINHVIAEFEYFKSLVR